ncbi:hypothetical protein ACS126_16495 [Sphingobacterium lactis]|uniref:hypothetical protein n=1 Tax=Sphingobacterium lactis TaxID=797291 RepID=UPI003EC83FA3
MGSIKEIKSEEMIQINGGSEFSDWTWRKIGQGVGFVVNTVEDFFTSQSHGVGNIGGPTANQG